MQNVTINITDVLNRLKIALSLEKDADIARLIGDQANKIAVWKLRNTVPYEKIVTLCSDKGLRLEWVLTGKGQPLDSCEHSSLIPGPEWQNNYGDQDLAEIIEILQTDLPEAKPNILKILRAKKALKDALHEWGVNENGNGL